MIRMACIAFKLPTIGNSLKSLYTLKLLLLLICFFSVFACENRKPDAGPGKLRVVTTLFPIYDFARNVGGDLAEVTLLLPPGVEPHSFEPTPETIITLSRADLFIYAGSGMEPWAIKLADGVSRGGKPVRCEAGKGAHYLASSHGHGEHNGDHDELDHGRDPHIWLDPYNAQIMIDRIAEGFVTARPAAAEKFAANAAAYKERLRAMESRFSNGLAVCTTREFVHGGHYAFAYLADRYKLRYLSAYGVTAESEPSSQKLMELVRTIKAKKLHYIFFEELLSPRAAETVAAETGVALLKLHGIHNVTRSELDSGVTYLSLMEQNLTVLKKGLECR